MKLLDSVACLRQLRKQGLTREVYVFGNIQVVCPLICFLQNVWCTLGLLTDRQAACKQGQWVKGVIDQLELDDAGRVRVVVSCDYFGATSRSPGQSVATSPVPTAAGAQDAAACAAARAGAAADRGAAGHAVPRAAGRPGQRLRWRQRARAAGHARPGRQGGAVQVVKRHARQSGALAGDQPAAGAGRAVRGRGAAAGVRDAHAGPLSVAARRLAAGHRGRGLGRRGPAAAHGGPPGHAARRGRPRQGAAGRGVEVRPLRVLAQLQGTLW